MWLCLYKTLYSLLSWYIFQVKLENLFWSTSVLSGSKVVVQILVPTHPDPGGVHSLGNANQPASDEPRKRMGRCSQPTVFQPEEEKVGSECDPSFLHCCVSCMLFDFSPLAEFFTKENFYDKSGEKLFERGDRSCARISPSWFGFLGWYIYIYVYPGYFGRV